ncbi:protein SMALL AUXIN UP-REGULATED RNA 51-like [Aristolochia californica]|uniref:protein SMALL AUXIN UP-REGULATED RNA 51-like n=1 Tax=Aristolochia californica TaxID=171875 RepID=UPI0035E1DC32
MVNDGGGPKVTGIRQIVRFRELLHKWHSISLRRPKGEKCRKFLGISPSMNKRLRDSCVIGESDEENCGQSPEDLPDIPKGYLAVYVGPELRRFIIPTTYLSLPVFKALLEKAEEEFGFDPNGALTIPCEIETFKYILQALGHNQKSQDDERIDNLSKTINGWD